jgi:hypothetical protein
MNQRFKMVPVYLGRFSRSGKVPTLAPLTITQLQMLRIANVGLESVKERLRAGRDERDSPYPSLQRNYNAWKSRVLRLPPGSAKRNFTLGRYSGKGPNYLKPKNPEDQLLHNLRIRKVSSVLAEARNSTLPARRTAGGLNLIYQRKGRKGWLLFSPKNIQEMAESVRAFVGSPVPLIFKNFTKVVERKTA